MGVIAAIILLEATRRTIGHALLVIILVFIVYTFFGGNLPGQLAHRGFDLPTVVEQLFFTTSSVFGTPLGVSATFIFLFILFGKFLEATGGGQFFIDLANAAMGKYRGGPAKTAVASSALMGTISGSAVANVVTTGAFTIPMIKRRGTTRRLQVRWKPFRPAVVKSCRRLWGLRPSSSPLSWVFRTRKLPWRR